MAFKYHKQYRLPGFNYASAGYYFITICTHNRECYFGDIINDEMRLSAIGEIAAKCWRDILNHFDFVSLDEWCVQPNHLHGIVIINGNQSDGRNGQLTVPTKNSSKNPLQPQPNSLSIIIRTYKAAVTTELRKRDMLYTVWQPRFHDHIIPARNATHSVAGGRTEPSLQKIRQYIKYNHLKWKQDIFYQTKKWAAWSL